MTISTYDTPTEVTAKQYATLMSACRGSVAGRIADDGKYYIKVWLDLKYVNEVLDSVKD